jgi:hypothetical protein
MLKKLAHEDAEWARLDWAPGDTISVSPALRTAGEVAGPATVAPEYAPSDTHLTSAA